MTSCTNCGNELGVGRFCTNCGQPIEWRTDTAERAPVPPAPKLPPPAPADLPPKPRFPLFADEIPPVSPVPQPRTEQLPAQPPPPVPPPPPPAEPAPHRRGAGPWVAWLSVAVALVLVAGLGGWLLTRGDGDDGSTASDTPSDSPRPSGQQSEPPSSAAPTSLPGELAGQSDVVVPATAPPNQDVSGNPVTYAGANMLDGVPDTCWRMPGDGTGDEITVTLPAATRLRSVGIVNGYAKSAQDAKGRELDWYHGNRRVLSVEWVFDDGTTVVQTLGDTTDLQSVDVDATTTTVTVRLLEVSKPGKGPAARDYTAISDLSVVGR